MGIKAIDWWPCKKSKSLGDSHVPTERILGEDTHPGRRQLNKRKEAGANLSLTALRGSQFG